MAISDTIKSMRQHTLEAYDAVVAKGGTVPSEKNLDNLAEAIGTIEGGGGGGDQDFGTAIFRYWDEQEQTTKEKSVKLDVRGCMDLSGAVNPTSRIHIGNEEYEKSELLEYDTGDTLDFLPAYAFGSNSQDGSWEALRFDSLRKIRLGKNIKETPYGMFSYLQEAWSLKEVEMVAVEKLGDYFGQGTGVRGEAYRFPDTLVEFGDNCFRNCDSWSPFTWPKNLKKIGDNFLYNGSLWNELAFPDSVTEIGYNLLGSCSVGSQVTFPAGMERVPDNFMNSASLWTHFVFQEGIKHTGNYTMSTLKGRAEITLPSTLEALGNNFLSNCTEADFDEAITIPASVTSIEYGAFMNDSNLLEIEALGHPPVDLKDNTNFLSVYGKTAPAFTQGVTITGEFADEWREALPNRMVSPYRRIVGNTDPQPYFWYWTKSGGDEPIGIYAITDCREYLSDTGTRTGWTYFPKDVTKIEFTPACIDQPVLRITGTSTQIGVLAMGPILHTDYQQHASDPSPIEEIIGLKYLTYTGYSRPMRFSRRFHYLPELRVVDSLPPSIVSQSSSPIFYQCPKFNSPIDTGCLYSGDVEYPGRLVSYCDSFDSPISFKWGDGQIGALGAVDHCDNFNSPITIKDGSVGNTQSLVWACPKFNQPITIPETVTRSTGLVDSCDAFASSITLLGSTEMQPRMTSKVPNFVGPLNVGERTPAAYAAPDAVLSVFRDDSPMATPMYTQGVTLTGKNAQLWKDTFPDLDGPNYYRKLIVGNS